MDFVLTIPNCEMTVTSLVTLHYFEYTSDFFFPGEAHNFWELLYVDKGEVEITAGEDAYLLKKGDIFFHPPMEFHSLWANGVSAPNLIVVSFTSDAPAMALFEHKCLQIGDRERLLLARIISEAQETFPEGLSDPHQRELVRKPGARFGAEQMIKISLEELLISLVRGGEGEKRVEKRLTSSIKEKSDLDVVARIVAYLEEHISQNLTLDDVCRDNLIGRSYLQKIFKARQGCGVIDYFSRLKMDAAKSMIRKGTQNFTQISRNLGFTSIHYFSRRFKKIAGMTPTEYASSIKVISESAKNRPEP